MNRIIIGQRSSTVHSSLITHHSSLTFVVLALAVAAQAFAAGIPEPGVILFGQVKTEDGSLVTEGRLVWTYTSQGGTQTVNVQVAADLNPFGDEAGTTYSYRVLIPAEKAVDGATISGLTENVFQPSAPLRRDTDYCWHVEACNRMGDTAGPVWTFRTAFGGDLQKLLEFLLGKRSLSFAEQSALDLNLDGGLDVADLVLGLKRISYGMSKPGAQLLADDARPQKTAWTGQETVALGTAWVKGYETVQVELPVDVLPSAAHVAGINLHVEADPGVIEFVGCRPETTNTDEDIYFHSPYPGVLNIVFFANPAGLLQCRDTTVLKIDLRVTPPAGWTESKIRLTVAALADIGGVSAPNVQRQDGFVRLQTFTPSRHWQLYR